MSYQTELSNLSYTNKDFSQIYPELLELVQKISYKWDPMYSDESDPGVILLKLAAIMADKCNYNIDKNTLEQFPLSVTQQANARQLFDQCGYTMRYYNSATTTLKLRLTNEPQLTIQDFRDMGVTDSNLELVDLLSDASYTRYYTIPRFTMFSDADNSAVFTITDDVIISSDGKNSSVTAVEGAVSTLDVNGTTLISRNMLDSENRIYFPTLNIAENGIFISNAESEELWEAKDNLLIHPPKSKIYKFGLTLDGKRCFVEFPSDISSIMGDGVVIRYVTTSGYSGNIRAKLLKRFFNEIKCSRSLSQSSSNKSQSVDITEDHVYIVNDSATTNGKDPETIDDAYRNYQRVKNTFSTLVTTKDYTDYLVTNKQLSNCVVCDRSDDVQSSYKVLNTVDGVAQLIPLVHQKEKSVTVKTSQTEEAEVTILTDEMSAFDLRVYGLKYVDAFNDYDDFRKSFNVEYQNLKYRLESTNDVKCIAHNYVEFEKNKIIILKNRYPIVAKIVSSSMLTEAQKDDIRSNVRYALYQLLNSRKINFGEEIDYTTVYNTILKADNRITAVALEDFQYETYAVYLNDINEPEIIRIDANSTPPTNGCSNYREYRECGVCKYCLWKKFRTEIYARSVLQGNTPLFPSADSFSATLADAPVLGDVIYDVEDLTSSTEIALNLVKGAASEPSFYISNTLHENDVISITSPNLVMDQRYSSYVQYITNIGITGGERKPYNTDEELLTVVNKNSDYVLQPNEYIIFFWRTSEDDAEPYTYIKYTGRDDTKPTIISPSFNLVEQTDPEPIAGTTSIKILDDEMLKFGDTLSEYSDGKKLTIDSLLDCSGYINITWQANATNKSSNFNKVVNRFIIGERFNVKDKAIETKKINKIHLNNTDDGTTQFYWILNNTTAIQGSDKSVYRLFTADANDLEYTLKEGEQLIYADPQKNQFYILGTGTKIERTLPSNTTLVNAWDCPVLDNKLQFLLDGPSYFDDDDHPWFDLKTHALSCNLYATEMQFFKLGRGSKLHIQIPTNPSSSLDELPSSLFVTSNEIDATNPEVQLYLCSLYVESESGTIEALPDRKNPTIAWNIRSALNLNMSSDSPQRLYAGQKLQWDDVAIEGSDQEHIYVQSSIPLAQSGGEHVDVRTYDVLTESYKPSKLYVYKLRDADLSFDGEQDTLWNFTNEGVSVEGSNLMLSNLRFESGNYIVPVTMSNIVDDVKLYWKQLRNIDSYALTSKERDKLSEIFENLPVGENLAIWETSRKPTQLSDFVSWVYSYIDVDVSKMFLNKTVKDILEDISLDGSEIPDLGTYNSTYKELVVDRANLKVGDVICRYKNDEDAGIEYQDTFVVISDTNQCVGVYKNSATLCKKMSLEDVLRDNSYAYAIISPSKGKFSYPSDDEPDINSTDSMITILNEIPNSNGTYFYSVVLQDDCTYTLQVQTTKGDVSPRFHFGKLRKFTYLPLTDQSSGRIEFFDDVVARVKEMDTTKRFNFIQDISEDMLIKYPLKSSAFLDGKHALNRFTICEYTIENLNRNKDLSVLDRLR